MYKLVSDLESKKVIKNVEVRDAMLICDRKYYMTIPDTESAYRTSPSQIGCGATISAPNIHAMSMEVLLPYLKTAHSIIDIGSGSGIVTAMMAILSPKARVTALEHIKELYKRAQDNNMHLDKEIKDRITYVHGDGRLGYPREAPFDVIYVGAAMEKSVYETLCGQLNHNGVMLAPLQHEDSQKLILTRRCNDRYIEEQICDVMFIPLTSKNEQIKY